MGKRLCHAAQSVRHNTLVPKRTELAVLTAAQDPLPGCKQVRMPLTRAGMKGLAPLWSGGHWNAGRTPAQVSHKLQLFFVPLFINTYFSKRLNIGSVTQSVITDSSPPSRQSINAAVICNVAWRSPWGTRTHTSSRLCPTCRHHKKPRIRQAKDQGSHWVQGPADASAPV